MVNADGTAKSLPSILAKKGINTTRIKNDDMKVVLSNHDGFIDEKMSVEHYVEGCGHIALFSILNLLKYLVYTYGICNLTRHYHI